MGRSRIPLVGRLQDRAGPSAVRPFSLESLFAPADLGPGVADFHHPEVFPMKPFILMHGPLLGPFTWVPVAAELRKMGATVVVPGVTSPGFKSGTFWEHHRDEFALELTDVELDTAQAVLVGHGDAGPLLPQLGPTLASGPAAYILVDSDLPKDGASRFDLFQNDDEVARFRQAAVEPYSPRGRLAPQPAQGGDASDESLRGWPEDILREALTDVPDTMVDVQSTVFAGKRPTPIGIFDEPIPMPAGWPEAPCAYVQLSKTYAPAAAEAKSRGWPVRELPSSHVQMLLDPEGFAAQLVSVADDLLGG